MTKSAATTSRKQSRRSHAVSSRTPHAVPTRSSMNPPVHPLRKPHVAYTSNEDNFGSLVAKIMLMYDGDFSQPQENSLLVVEQYVKKKLIQMLLNAQEIASKRETKYILFEDILFLLRDDPQQIDRLITFLKVYEVKGRKKHASITPQSTLKARRLVRRYDAIRKLDPVYEQTKEVHELPHQHGNVFLITSKDQERMSASVILKRNLTQVEDEAFSKSAEVAYGFADELKKFKTWLRLDLLNILIQDNVLVALSYLAYEKVSLVTQTALIVKNNMQLNEETQIETLLSKASGIMSESRRQRLSTIEKDSPELRPSLLFVAPRLQPMHIFEAIRRLETEGPQKDKCYYQYYENFSNMNVTQ